MHIFKIKLLLLPSFLKKWKISYFLNLLRVIIVVRNKMYNVMFTCGQIFYMLNILCKIFDLGDY